MLGRCMARINSGQLQTAYTTSWNAPSSSAVLESKNSWPRAGVRRPLDVLPGCSVQVRDTLSGSDEAELCVSNYSWPHASRENEESWDADPGPLIP